MVDLGSQLLFFDAGSGLFDASAYASNHPNKNIKLFFSHVHLDHIMGLPFFAPVWNPAHTVDLYAGSLKPYGGIEHFLSQTFNEPLFPVKFKNFPGVHTCIDFEPGATLDFAHQGYVIQTAVLNHPNGAVGYRVNAKGHSFCYVTDTEHRQGEVDQSIVNLIQGADLFVYDSSYSDDTYAKYKGWGHSTWQEAIRLGQAAGVKKIGVFHHDPLNTDSQLALIEQMATTASPNVMFTRQGMVVDLLNGPDSI
jgi:phosphoribosyl 1,2-cyclic phosphodiesterase